MSVRPAAIATTEVRYRRSNPRSASHPATNAAKRVGQEESAGRSEQPEKSLRQDRARGEDRQAGDAGHQIDHLAGHAEPGAERGAADEHDHRLQRERHGRERQGDADLRRHRRQDRDEEDGRGANGSRHIGARGNGREERRAGAISHAFSAVCFVSSRVEMRLARPVPAGTTVTRDLTVCTEH